MGTAMLNQSAGLGIMLTRKYASLAVVDLFVRMELRKHVQILLTVSNGDACWKAMLAVR